MRFCEICKQTINPERAEALPDTRLCLEHARLAEKYGGEFTLTSEVETTSKVGSLKKNYGGVNISRTRNLGAILRLIEDYDQANE